ncbi:MAG: hypothetical protein DWG74_02845 [Chloroflexi bacterium]|nr:hypothetical protein [Chloroflexota bacterium]
MLGAVRPDRSGAAQRTCRRIAGDVRDSRRSVRAPALRRISMYIGGGLVTLIVIVVVRVILF